MSGSLRQTTTGSSFLQPTTSFFWRCIKEDSASWVVLIFKLASLIGETDAGTLVWGQFKDDQKFIEEKPYHNDGLGQWAKAYTGWVQITHDPGRPAEAGADPQRSEWAASCLKSNGWNCLAGRTGLPSHDDKTSSEIIDVAVGNWNNTVVTYYLLLYSEERKSTVLFYIDEEIIMHTWQEVPRQEGPIERSSRICASHSVIGVATGRLLHWIRLDAHQPGNIDVWPLNWSESWNDGLVSSDKWWSDLILLPFDLQGRTLPISPSNVKEEVLLRIAPFDTLNADNYLGWHTATAPDDVYNIDEFLIDVGFGKRPWPVPEPGLYPRIPFVDATRVISVVWKLYLLMASYSAIIDQMRGQEGGTEIGFLGENPVKPNSRYPVCCIVKCGDRYKGFAVPEARAIREEDWQDIDAAAASGIRGAVRRGMAQICHFAYGMQNGCFNWASDTFVCDDGGFERCAQEEDHGYEECARKEDQGYQRCGEHRLQCPDWAPGWACNAANTLAEWICVAWVWVSNLVCVAWRWVSNLVCVAWEWVSFVMCSVVKTVVKGVCSAVAGGLKAISCWAFSCWNK